jgi:hypothetical protein
MPSILLVLAAAGLAALPLAVPARLAALAEVVVGILLYQTI